MRGLIAALLLATGLLVSAASPSAAAQDDPTTSIPNGEGATGYRERYVFAGFLEPPVEVVTPTRGGSYQPTHFCIHLPISLALTGVDHAQPDALRVFARTLTEEDFGGPLRLLLCYRAGGVLFHTALVSVPAGDPTAGQITTIESVARFAQRLVTVPAPTVRTSPPATRLITGLETWFDTTVFDPPERSAQAGPLWATARAIAGRIELVPEPGAPPVVCAISGAGPVRCRHTYVDVDPATGTRNTTATVRVVYDVELTTSDNPTPRVVDTITSDPATLPVTIREIQTVLR
jgi:hypothetical protein